MSDRSNVEFSEREALFFHATGRPGKIEIVASKPMATQRDLSLAYSPGVAVPVRAIAADPARLEPMRRAVLEKAGEFKPALSMAAYRTAYETAQERARGRS